MHATTHVQRYTVTPSQQTRRISISFESADNMPLSYPRETTAAAQPTPLGARSCQSLRGTAVLAVSVLGGGLAGWASYALSTQAGGSNQTALGIGACVGSVVGGCVRAGLLHLLENRNRQRVATLAAAPGQSV